MPAPSFVKFTLRAEIFAEFISAILALNREIKFGETYRIGSIANICSAKLNFF